MRPGISLVPAVSMHRPTSVALSGGCDQLIYRRYKRVAAELL
jgi:hypothetical protein